MIERIRFKNFKALKDAEFKLGAFNVLVGANGSGKSTVFQAIQTLAQPDSADRARLLTVGVPVTESIVVEADFKPPIDSVTRLRLTMIPRNKKQLVAFADAKEVLTATVQAFLRTIRVLSLDPSKIPEAVPIAPGIELGRTGANLAAVLDRIRDLDEDAFSELKEELRSWMPEFDNIIFDTPHEGLRGIKLRRAIDKGTIPSSDLSEGTLLALCLLTIAYNPDVPPLICLEEPDRALHPRLLREVRDALYRLAFPQEYGLTRKPVQVIVTTHSPYFLDLFRDHPEQIIVAEKQDDGTARFHNLSDDPNLREIIGDASLGEVWYSGILGGVPVGK